MPTLDRLHVSDAAITRPITQRLVAKYAGRQPASQVEAAVAAAGASLATARVRTFVPIFIERLAREMLDASPQIHV